jgi:hypothetical protein
MSWDLGPTLAGWLGSDEGDPVAYRGFVDGDGGRHGLAQPFHHTILPLASPADRRTEIRWGLRDFEWRFGRRPTGMWLPETAVDLATLRELAEAGIEHTILAPWQLAGDGLDTRRPARVDLGDGRSMVVAIYDGLLSAAVSFEADATVDADAFAGGRLWARFNEPGLAGGAAPLVVIATDGELYGHHRPDREHFLARLVGATAPAGRSYATPSLAEALAVTRAGPLPIATLVERTSWSCHHGVARWGAGCGCVPDSSWKLPLRVALERLAGGIDAATEMIARALPGAPDPWAARDAYVDVVIGAEPAAAFAVRHLGAGAPGEAASRFLAVMEAQRWRLSMFASCAWFWESPERIETATTLRAATHAARRIDGLVGTHLERRLVEDLRVVTSSPA